MATGPTDNEMHPLCDLTVYVGSTVCGTHERIRTRTKDTKIIKFSVTRSLYNRML